MMLPPQLFESIVDWKTERMPDFKLRHRIIPRSSPGMTSRDPFDGKPGAPDGPMPTQRRYGIG